MANIYNDNNSNSGGVSQNIVSQNITAENAYLDNIYNDTSFTMTALSKGDILIIEDNHIVDGLTISPNNEVLCSNGIIPEWRNSLILQDLAVNTLKIAATTTGDILTFNSNSQAQRVPIGLSGTFLQSDGSNVSWSPLPDPFILGSLVVNQNLTLVNYGNKNIITNSAGQVVSERIQYHAGSASINNTPSQLYGNATWSFTQNAWYSLKVQINCNFDTQYKGQIKVQNIVIGNIYNFVGPSTQCFDFTYNHINTTGIYGLALDQFYTITPSAVDTISYSFRVERIPEPIIHS